MSLGPRHSESMGFGSRTPRILIVRVGAMGDVLHALPAVAQLRESLPHAHLGWAIEPRWEPLLRLPDATARDTDRMPLVDAVHRVEAKQWNKQPFSLATARSVAALRRELRAQRYDFAIDLQGTLRSAAIARMSGAERVVGSASPRESAARWLYRSRVRTAAEHVTNQAVQIVAAVGSQICKAPGAQIRLADPPAAPLPRSDEAGVWWQRERQRLCVDRPPVLLAATAGWGAKEWPPEKFAAFSSLLVERGFSVLLNTTPGQVDAVTARVLELVRLRHPQAVPQVHALGCTLPQLIAATRTAGAVIAGDTGPLHLAAALRVPTVGLFGPTAPERTGPRHRTGVNLRDPGSVTDHRRHAETEAGLSRISVEAVLAALDAVLAAAGQVR